jgi:hypothetical protein
MCRSTCRHRWGRRRWRRERPAAWRDHRRPRKRPSGPIDRAWSPSSSSRRAYANLTEGGQRLLSKYRSVGAKNSDFFPALNRGDLATVAHILFLAHYYTGSETAYAARMKEWRAVIDRQLGPTS